MTYDRLKKEKDFNLVFKKGKRIQAETLGLCYIPSKQLKVGFSVGKRHGKSVVRNRLKRILRESFRSFSQDIRENFFFVFIPKPQTPKTGENRENPATKSQKKTIKYGYSYDKIKRDMKYLLLKGGFIKND